jgi:hypothetical protein
LIEVLADGLPSRTDVASKIPLSKHAVEVGLSGAQTTVNALSDVLASPRFRIATGVDADQPCAESAANDLANLAGHISSYDERCGTHLAHLADGIGWFCGRIRVRETDGGSVAAFPRRLGVGHATGTLGYRGDQILWGLARRREIARR